MCIPRTNEANENSCQIHSIKVRNKPKFTTSWCSDSTKWEGIWLLTNWNLLEQPGVLGTFSSSSREMSSALAAMTNRKRRTRQRMNWDGRGAMARRERSRRQNPRNSLTFAPNWYDLILSVSVNMLRSARRCRCRYYGKNRLKRITRNGYKLGSKGKHGKYTWVSDKRLCLFTSKYHLQSNKLSSNHFGLITFVSDKLDPILQKIRGVAMDMLAK